MPTSIVGSIKNLDTTNPGDSSFVRFWLRGCRGNTPRITGTGAIAPQAAGNNFYVDVPANSSGVLSGSIYSTRAADGVGNGEIEVGGSYTAVNYGMQIFNAGIPGPEIPVHAKIGASLDVSNITPLTMNPIVATPTGDSTYARIDGGNLPFLGAISSSTGFRQGTMTAGRVLQSDGTNFVSTAPTGTGTPVLATSPTIGSPTLAGTTPINRLRANQGTAMTAAKFGTLTGWGTTASVGSVAGTDSAFTFTVTSNGTGQTANPTLVVTFADGTWTNAPIVITTTVEGTTSDAPWVVVAVSATSVTLRFNLSTAPTAGQTIAANVICIGK